MTFFYFIRHGSTDTLGKVLTGRSTGIHLNSEGLEQARRLGERFKTMPVNFLYSSPLERTMETAAPIAAALGLEIQPAEDVIEVDYGEWTGRVFETDLKGKPDWIQYNSFRTGARIPGGEHVLRIQDRMVQWTERTRRQHPGKHIAVVSHGDPIKTVVVHYAGLHLDMFHRIDIGPASVTVIRIDDHAPLVMTVNNTEYLPH